MPTAAASAAVSAVPTRSPLIGWLAVVSVMSGIFSIVTAEILPIGLLTSVGADFDVSDGAAGLMMTVPGVLAAIAAPAVTVATGRLDRRLMLCALMLLLAVADFLAAAAPAYWVMVVSRILVGLVIGGFWSIGAGLAVRLVRAEQVGTATAVIFSAVPLGSVLGVPAGTLIGHLMGWRAAFVVMGVMTVGVFLALIVLVPPLPAVQVTRLKVLGDLIRGTGIRVGLVLTFLIVTAHFGTYTYVTPFLQQVTRVSPGLITTFLLAYGVAGIVGNFIAGVTVTRDLRATFAVSGCVLAGATSLLPVLGRGETGAIVLLVLWGLAYGAVPVCSQTWFSTSAPHATEAASILFTSSFQATIAIGALLGGVVVDAASPSAVMVCGGAIATLMVLTVAAGQARPSSPRT
ncbi:putative MFS family arabinose efflux permease [Streptosporangium album]|uniref:Putative MFS family arabinose efflux permease n=1 Tax=Streptosporangium album TaxID=47479 RepID=A0A7W7W8E7_9ACTN|nr:MFS transporter [Streptosporangium album]MBB4936900.1 putative MFS family arabinose efflux permease [Streptosporangium album]